MSPRDENLLKVVYLLVLLFRTKKQNAPNLPSLEQHTLKVTQEHLDKNKLTISLFHNALTLLDTKGYLYGFSVIEDKFYNQLDKFFDDKEFKKALKEIKKADSPELNSKLKDSIANYYEKRLPPDYGFDREGLMAEPMTLEQIITEGREKMKDPSLFGGEDKPVSIVLLMPFRSIERLYDEMDKGKSFEEVKDAGIWYETEAQIFHFDDQSISTKHNRTPYTHYALQSLFSEFGNKEIYFAEIPEFDSYRDLNKELKSYYDSLSSFVDKHPRLKDIFTVHNKYLEIHEEYLDQSH